MANMVLRNYHMEYILRIYKWMLKCQKDLKKNKNKKNTKAIPYYFIMKYLVG
jgi:hypothetical protein